MLARDLGFMNAPALKGWAGQHPEIWGSRYGRRMFDYDGAPAFGKPPLAPVMVSEIVARWRAVHPDRISALAALEGYGPAARVTTAVESCPGGYRLVRRPYLADLLSLRA